MKYIAIALFSIISSFSYANEYEGSFKCRSYNTGNIVEYSDVEKTLVYKDRFGNELNQWNYIELSDKEGNTILLYQNVEILKLNKEIQEADFILYQDSSYQCKIH